MLIGNMSKSNEFLLIKEISIILIVAFFCMTFFPAALRHLLVCSATYRGQELSFFICEILANKPEIMIIIRIGSFSNFLDYIVIIIETIV